MQVNLYYSDIIIRKPRTKSTDVKKYIHFFSYLATSSFEAVKINICVN